jgi:hypothetical protein
MIYRYKEAEYLEWNVFFIGRVYFSTVVEDCFLIRTCMN